MTTKKLTLIKGGKAPTGSGSRKRRKPPRRLPHPYNDLLFQATSRLHYPGRATSAEIIAQRMTRLSKRILGHQVRVTGPMAVQCIFDGRKRRLAYGWQLLNVAKGASNDNRGYVPVLVDVDKEDFEWWLIEDTDLPYVIGGIQSALHTQASMLEVSADGLAFAAATREQMGHKADAWQELSDDAHYLARRMRRLTATADAL